MQFGDVKFFTDITITLAWTQSPSRNFKPFVSSRVGEIQSNPDLSQWMYIPSEDNVADDLSQGIHMNAEREIAPNTGANAPKFFTLATKS